MLLIYATSNCSLKLSLECLVDITFSFVTPLEASFVFATTTEANYLSRFVDARISCINHIPVELLGKCDIL